ncbi:hypothetical protein [Teredinibacter waterburyi]|uniref:hypothetical protein n=1 Tax=Teredinibacter waterburyi TaxID=1500538 RepID=UPI00165FE698|nr:hypothetical protein [Teredinibacter waterburyi]
MSQQPLKKLNAAQLIDLAHEESDCAECAACTKEKFKSWSNISLEVKSNISPVGEFEDAEADIKKNAYTELHPNGSNYWSADAPIAIHFYPYHESKINLCKECKAVLLTYTEFAGHAPQHRIRYVDKDLIVD